MRYKTKRNIWLLTLLLGLFGIINLLYIMNPRSINRIDPLIIKSESLLNKAEIVPLTLEHSTSINDIQWGLMGRKSLPENHGMSFNFPVVRQRTFWSFNCFIDLSVAFLDQNKIIREIKLLKSYPEKMDSNRPFVNLTDMEKYPPYDPIINFYRDRALNSSSESKYVIEMNSNWFRKNNIIPGDVIIWSIDKEDAYISSSVNIDEIKIDPKNLIAIEFQEETIHTLWSPKRKEALDIIAIDFEGSISHLSILFASSSRNDYGKNVFKSFTPVKYIIATPVGTIKRYGLKLGDHWDLKLTNATRKIHKTQ